MDPRVVMGDLQEAMVDLPVVTEAPQVVMGDLQAGPQVHKSKFKNLLSRLLRIILTSSYSVHNKEF